MKLGANGWGRLHNRRVDVELLEVKPSTVQVIEHGAQFHCSMAARPVPKVRDESHETGLCPTQPLQLPDELWGNERESDISVDIKHELTPSVPPHRVGLASRLGHTIPYMDASIAQQSLEKVMGRHPVWPNRHDFEPS